LTGAYFVRLTVGRCASLLGAGRIDSFSGRLILSYVVFVTIRWIL